MLEKWRRDIGIEEYFRLLDQHVADKSAAEKARMVVIKGIIARIGLDMESDAITRESEPELAAYWIVLVAVYARYGICRLYVLDEYGRADWVRHSLVAHVVVPLTLCARRCWR